VTHQQNYERQRTAFTAAMERDGWTAAKDIFGGVCAWTHSSDENWPVSDKLAFTHYVRYGATWRTPAVVQTLDEMGGELPF
jgi:hypothetical protein